MKKAYIYIRVSTEDQRDNWSVEGQQQSCLQYCERMGYQVAGVWKDEAQSAKSFDRPAWTEMQGRLKKERIAFIVVQKYDRFSRNVAEGLRMFERLEEKMNVRVVSVMEDLGINAFSPMFWKYRADALTNAQFERMMIADRTAGGRYYAAKTGRWVGPAPYGYDNERDERNKPIITVNEHEAQAVRRMFTDYLSGRTFADIRANAVRNGWKARHKDAVRRVLQNPVYAGLIVTPEYSGEARQYIQGLHRPLVSEDVFWQVQERLNGKAPRSAQGEDQLPLRGFIHCQECAHFLTGSRSRGKTGNYWHYYRCLRCTGQNFRGDRAHEEMHEILNGLSYSKSHLGLILQKTERAFEQRLKTGKANAHRAESALRESRQKMDALEEKYLAGRIDDDFYNRWNIRYRAEIASAETALERSTGDDAAAWKHLSATLPKLTHLETVYDTCKSEEKVLFLRLLLGNQVEKLSKGYRTQYVNPLFDHNAMNINLLQIKNGTTFEENLAGGSMRSLYGTKIEPVLPHFEALAAFFNSLRA